jgi:hypothetical protein
MLLDVQVPFQWIGERSMTMIKVAEIGSVDRGARKDASRDG